jgi:hypothetical protein
LFIFHVKEVGSGKMMSILPDPDQPYCNTVSFGVQGRRNFVVAANGYTKVFSKSGKQVKSFPSNLPGGNRNQVSSQYILHTHKTGSLAVLRIYACADPDRVQEFSV